MAILLMSVIIVLCTVSPIKAQATDVEKTMSKLYERLSKESSTDLFQKGNDLLQKGKLDEAMACFTIVGNRYNEKMNGDDALLCAKALNNAGGISQLRNNYSSAFSYYKRAIQIAEPPISQCYNNIAGIYLFFEDYDNARKYLSEAYDKGLKNHDYQFAITIFSNIILLDYMTDSIDDAVGRINELFKIKEIKNEPSYNYTYNLAQGVLAYHRKDYGRAIDFYEKGIDDNLPNEANNTHYLYIAKCYMQMGLYDKAMEKLEFSAKKAFENQQIDHLMTNYQYQIRCCEMVGDGEKLRNKKFQYLAFKDSICVADELGKIKNIEFFQEVDRYEKEVIKLNEQKRTANTISVIVSIALCLVGFLLYLVNQRHRKLKESNNKLFNRHKELVKQADIERQQHRRYYDSVKKYTSQIEQLQEQITTLSKQEKEKKKPSNSTKCSLSEVQSSMILEKIYQKMDDVAFICQQDFTIDKLSNEIGSNVKYVSQIINEKLGKNFNTLLNEFRIREACNRLVDFKHYGNMTNEAIAEGLGFKSRSHFTRTFKEITGLTPSQYQKIAKEDSTVGGQ